MSPVQFGKRVVGDKKYAEAVRNEEGGANVFGTRVRGAIPDSPTHREKRQSEFGSRVTRGASAQDREGNDAEGGVSIEEIKQTLAENPTYIDMLYEAELARADEPREDALRIFLQHETGIKGGGRRDMIEEIEALLGYHQTGSEVQANRQEALGETYDSMQDRMKENATLRDAGRIKALREREDNLKAVESSQRDSTVSQLSLTTEGQVNDKLGPSAGRGEVGPGSDASITKPDGPVHTETQQPGPRGADSPKGVEGEDGDSTSRRSRTETTEEPPARTPRTPKLPENPDELTKAELESLVQKLKIEDQVKGTGSEGAVVKADLVKAITKFQKQQEK